MANFKFSPEFIIWQKNQRLARSALALIVRNKLKRKKDRPRWSLPHVEHHDQESASVLLLPTLREQEGEGRFRSFTRLTPALFETLLGKITDNIRKKDTNWRKSVRPREKLEVTLRFLATGIFFLLLVKPPFH